MKTRILWLSKEREEDVWYDLWRKEPKWKICEHRFRGGNSIRTFCAGPFERLCGDGLKLRTGQKTKVRLTQLKNGIKLEKIK